ncbi:MAG: helix-turn-helix domain-containing protein [Actinomycetota bacterium]|nr:helix-turn-helix domain-containing protein [Actinomycetota bacterium]
MTDLDRPATITVEQAGALLGISRRSAYRAAASGHIPTIRLGRRILVPTAMLYRMLGITTKHDPASVSSPNRAASSREAADSGARTTTS